MSFAVWTQPPPFKEEDLTKGEKIIQVGTYWIVTDDPASVTQAKIDAALNPPSLPEGISDGQLAGVLKAKGIITDADIAAAVSIAVVKS